MGLVKEAKSKRPAVTPIGGSAHWRAAELRLRVEALRRSFGGVYPESAGPVRSPQGEDGELYV